MLYFLKEKDKIIKYHIEYDVDKILQIRQDIIDNCSYIRHFNYISTDKHIDNVDRIRNLKIDLCNIKTKDKHGNLVDTFHIEYDLYTYPIWIEIIDHFLKGNSETINDIFKEIKPTISPEKKQILNCIKEQANDLSNLSNLSNEYITIIKKLQLLGVEYENICQKEQENIKQDINYHKKRLQESITFLKIDELSLSEYDRLLNFFDKEPKILYMFKKQ